MSPEERLVAHLLELTAEQRVQEWERICAGDPLQRERLLDLVRLLGGANAAGGDPAAADGLADLLRTALATAPLEAVGTRIGRYKLLQKIGEGGFGTVWMAEQVDPIRRRVALKIVKAGLDTDEVVARFEAERQALALMDHPNIAQVFDAGATPGGRPYFVMELVRGIAITRYCDENRVPTEERLRLFIKVCQAVQHAHQKGVIHRDLKPSNILITLHDGEPVPKVIDFGIAKAMDKQLTERTLVTQFHAFVGTPVYTSPEQMEMSGLDVDTRSDIYSLGVLLYELLAGRPPFDADALVKSGLDAMRRTIREVDPPQPSRRVRSLNDAERTTIADRRRTDAARLPLLLRGDLDSIVMHCLEKDRTRRYDTASALAADVQRHLRREPVAARPASTWYHARKFVARHAIGVAAVVAIAAALVMALMIAAVALARERAAYLRARAAESEQARLRSEAVDERVAEAKRASRTAQAMAEQLLAENRSAEGLAQLVRAAHTDPSNDAIAARLMSVLAYRNFAEPVGPPIHAGGRVYEARYFSRSARCLTRANEAVQIWDLQTGRLERSFEGRAIVNACLNPGETALAIGTRSGSLQVYSVETGRRLFEPLSHGALVNWVEFSSDGKWLASASEDRTARIWNAETGAVMAVLGHDGGVTSATFSPDGRRLATTSIGGQWRLWRVPDGAPLTPFGSMRSRTDDARFSPDGHWLLIGDNSGAQLLDATTGDPVGRRFGHLAKFYRSAFSPDGEIAVTTAEDRTAKLWAVPSGQLIGTLWHGGAATTPRFTPDGRYLATASNDGLARIWSVASGKLAFEPIRVGDFGAVAFSPDGREFLTWGLHPVVRRWRLTPGNAMPLRLPSPRGWVAVAPDLAGPEGNKGGQVAIRFIYRDHMQTFDLRNGQPLTARRPFPTPIRGAVSSPNQKHLYVALPSGEAELWTLEPSAVVRHPIGPFVEGDPRYHRFSGDSRYLAVVLNRQELRVWECATGRLIIGPIAGGTDFDLSSDGRWLAAGERDGAVWLWDLAAGSRARRVGPPELSSGWVRFSPDGRFLATTDSALRIWNAATGQLQAGPLEQRWIIRGVLFTDDGERILVWTSVDVRIYDVRSGALRIEPIAGDNISVEGLTFTAAETRVAMVSRNTGEAQIWDGMSGQLLTDGLTGRREIAHQLRFMSGDRFLAMNVRSEPGIWAIPPHVRAARAPDWLLRLATAVGGGEIDDNAVFRERPAEPAVFDALRRELAALPDDAPYVAWGRWFLADRATRPIAPGFAMTAAEAERFVQQVNQP